MSDKHEKSRKIMAAPVMKFDSTILEMGSVRFGSVEEVFVLNLTRTYESGNVQEIDAVLVLDGLIFV